MQEIRGIDVGTDHACGCRRVEKRSKGGLKPLVEVGGQGFEGRVSRMQSRGESEEIVGKALKGRRDDIVLATKVNGPMGDDPNQQGNSRRWIIRGVEDSLRRLRTDHIDLYQIHRPSPDTDIEETLSALTDLMRAGKVRAIGSSTFPASEIVEAQWVAERRSLSR